jgi:hypothetical protein
MKKYLKSFKLFKLYLKSPTVNGYIHDFALKATDNVLFLVYKELKTVFKYCNNESFIIFKLQYILKRRDLMDIAYTILLSCFMGEAVCTGCPYERCKFMNGEYGQKEKFLNEAKEIL